MSPTERRERLLAWMRDYQWVFGREVAEWCPAYGGLSGCYRKAHIDLVALEREGKARRLPGRPARWEVVR